MQQQKMVLAGLDGAQHDKGRRPSWLMRDLVGRRSEVGAKQSCCAGRVRYIELACECLEAAQGGAAVGDHPSPRPQHGLHAVAMALGFAGTAELWVRDRDEVVDEIDRLDVGSGCPATEVRALQAGVADVQVQATAPRRAGEFAEHAAAEQPREL